MKILALDASSDHCSVAVHDDGKIHSDVSDVPRSHAQRMLPMVDTLLSTAQLGLNDIDLIALTHGPGSFTGIRIAVSVAQGLSYAASIPCLPMSSMSAMAYEYADLMAQKSLPNIAKGDVIIAALDARMQEVYWSVFEVGEHGLVEVRPPTLTPESHLLASVRSCIDSVQMVSASNVHCIGNGWNVPLVKEELPALYLNVKGGFQPSALGVLSMLKNNPEFRGFDVYSSHTKDSVEKSLRDLSILLCTAETLEPLYLRNEISWQKRTRVRDESSSIL